MAPGPRGTAAALDDPVAEEAIEWMVLLHSGEAEADDRRRLAEWRARDPRHDQAWQRLQGTLARTIAPIRQVDRQAPAQSSVMERVMLRPPAAPHRRQLLRRSLGLAAIGLATGALTHRFLPLQNLVADLSTGTGERRRFDLPDGSSLMLNARSAVDIRFSAGVREVRLRAGELIATVAADVARPFTVRTDHGTASALGARLLVGIAPDQSRSTALALDRGARVDNGAERLNLRRGEAAFFRPTGIERLPGDASGRSAWADGMLLAADQPLFEVIAALRPYREGFIRLSPEAARLRVLGAFPLDDTDNALRSLEQTMPLEIRRFGSLLVDIGLRSSA